MNNLSNPYKTGAFVLLTAALTTGCATQGDITDAFLENAHRINDLENRNRQLWNVLQQQNAQLAAVIRQLETERSKIEESLYKSDIANRKADRADIKAEGIKKGLTLHAGEVMGLTPLIPAPQTGSANPF
jgi:phosphopantetheine adenylyltransferase